MFVYSKRYTRIDLCENAAELEMKVLVPFADWFGNMYLPNAYIRKLVHTGLKVLHGPSVREKERLAVFVSEKKRFMFLVNPLVASQSMSAGLQFCAESEDFDLTIESHKVGEGPLRDLSPYYKFCIVRNPWERVVSCFHKKIANANTSYKLLLLSRHPRINLEMSFEDFVEFICSPDGKDEISDAHWMSQSRLLSTPDGAPLWDCAAKLEEFPAALRNAVSNAGIEAFELPTIGASEHMKIPRAFRSYREYYSKETWRKVAERYATDIEAFGYDYSL